MFPSESLLVLLNFARGKTLWGVEVLDAALDVVRYFGRLAVESPRQVVAGDVELNDPADALEQLIEQQHQDSDVAGLPPVLALTVLRFAISLLSRLI